MKGKLLILCLFSLVSCTDLSRLNNKIYEAQKQHLYQSPYQDTDRALLKIEPQKSFRKNQLPELLKEKVFYQRNLSDTLLILEDFDEICVNCTSYRMQVLYQDTVYFVERKIVGNIAVYQGNKEKFEPELTDEFGR